MFSPVMMFFSLLSTGFESPSLTSHVALDPSLQPHAVVSLNRAAVFNASCDCTRCEAIRATNALREQDLADRHTEIRETREERMRRLSKERWQRSQRSLRGLEGLSSGERPIVRV